MQCLQILLPGPEKLVMWGLVAPPPPPPTHTLFFARNTTNCFSGKIFCFPCHFGIAGPVHMDFYPFRRSCLHGFLSISQVLFTWIFIHFAGPVYMDFYPFRRSCLHGFLSISQVLFTWIFIHFAGPVYMDFYPFRRSCLHGFFLNS